MTENANLYGILRARFSAYPERLALESERGEQWSFAQLERQSATLSLYLRERGVSKGDRVAVQVQKSPQALLLYLACVRAGFVYLPLNTAYPPRELEFFLKDAEPKALIVDGEALPALEPLAAQCGVPVVLDLNADGSGRLISEGMAYDGPEEDVLEHMKAEDIAAVLYTSGTTGTPKGAMLTHANLSSNALTLHETWGFSDGDVLLHALPIFHTHGLFVACHCALLNASPMLFLPRFDAQKIIALMPRASVFMGVPTFYTRLLAAPQFDAQTCKDMRLFISGSAPLREQTFAEFKTRTGHTILERYGMTECGMSTSNPLHGERKPGTVGPPLAGVTLRVVGESGEVLPAGEVGGIEFKGPHVFKGYWRQPQKTAQEFSADGYFKSGDLGLIDAQGYVSIVGRNKDLIITGGFNVYPKEVELRIDEVDGVLESAVIGLPDDDFGEAVTAVVVRDDANGPTDSGAITAKLKEELANYKVPKSVHFVDELPRNAMGKVQKNVLRDRFNGA